MDQRKLKISIDVVGNWFVCSCMMFSIWVGVLYFFCFVLFCLNVISLREFCGTLWIFFVLSFVRRDCVVSGVRSVGLTLLHGIRSSNTQMPAFISLILPRSYIDVHVVKFQTLFV